MPDITFTDAALTPMGDLNPGAKVLMQRMSSSRSQRKIQEDMVALRAQLEATGQLKPATIINFNPVPLVQDGLINLTVPAAGTSETGRVEWEHGGNLYIGHAMTIRTPILYPSTEGSGTDQDTLVDMPTLAAKALLPIGIAFSFLEHYSGNAKDSAHMGGVLVFEGDRNTLKPEKLEKRNGMLDVPIPIGLPRNQRAYGTKQVPLQELADDLFLKQSIYADQRIQQAHSLWTTNDPMQQKQITDLDRTWARFALGLKMIDSLPEWVRARVTSGAALLSVVRCPVCQKPRPAQNVYLCPDDRAPYNAFEAFMAGMPVAQHFLDILPQEELEAVARETVQRQERMKLAMAKARKVSKANAEQTLTPGEDE